MGEHPFIRILDHRKEAKLKDYVYDVVGCCMSVHRALGCWLNEYMYQDALEIALRHNGIPFEREHRFHTCFEGEPLAHFHQLDFLVRGNIIVECKAVTALGVEQKQQLWNYLRLTKKPIGILWNFAPVKDQCQKYFYDKDTGYMYPF